MCIRDSFSIAPPFPMIIPLWESRSHTMVASISQIGWFGRSFIISMETAIPWGISSSRSLSLIHIFKYDEIVFDQSAWTTLETNQDILFIGCLQCIIQTTYNIVSAWCLSAGKDNTCLLYTSSQQITHTSVSLCKKINPLCHYMPS